MAGLHALANQRGNDMAGMQVEIIAGSVQIHRQQIDRVQSVLLPIALTHHQQRFFGDAVRGVGDFGETVPEIRFFERDRR